MNRKQHPFRQYGLQAFLFLCFWGWGNVLQAQWYEVRGRVQDQEGAPLPFANIYLETKGEGTSANESGWFTLKLEAGKHQLSCQYLGYTTFSQSIVLPADTMITIRLKREEFQLSELIVDPSFNPANRIMRNAIASKKQNRISVKQYSCKAYVKALQKINEAPSSILGVKINTSGLLTGPKNSGILYLSESVSRLYFTYPNRFKEQVISSKVSGKSQGFTWNSAQDLSLSFYDNYLEFPVVGLRPFVSPLSDRAFLYYQFKLLGRKIEAGKTIYSIQVTPKRNSDPVFSGVIHIADSTWNIQGLKLRITKSNPVQYLDTLTITQYFMPVSSNIWLPSQLRFDAKGSFLGVKGEGYYLGVFSEYKIPGLSESAKVQPVAPVTPPKPTVKNRKKVQAEEPKFKKNEVLQIEASANERTNLYWDSIRPVPLEQVEIADYAFKDSLESFRATPVYKDSMDKKNNVPGPRDILMGYRYRISKKQLTIGFPGLLKLVNYNTIEGINLQFRFSVSKTFESKRSIAAAATGRYGFSNRYLNGFGTISFRTNPKHEEQLTFSGGRYVSQFNEAQPQTELGNTFTTLIFRWNFMKLYQQYFAKAYYDRELYPGIHLRTGMYYAKRSPLENTSYYSFFSRKKDFSWNGVHFKDADSTNYNIRNHQLLRFDFTLKIHFGQQYINRPNMIIELPNHYPTLTLGFKQAIPVNQTDFIQYTFAEAHLEGDIDCKILGRLNYKLGGGGFPLKGKFDYPEYKQFSSNFLNPGETDLLGFHLIRYYRFGTAKYFAEFHAEQHFSGFFFNKIPGFRKLKLQEVAGFHFLYTPERKAYYQMDIGIENIFKVLRVDMVIAFGGQTNNFIGARIGTLLDVN